MAVPQEASPTPTPPQSPATEHVLIPDYLTLDDFRMLFETHGIMKEVGARVFNVLGQNAARNLEVPSLADFDPSTLPPADRFPNPLVRLWYAGDSREPGGTAWLMRQSILDSLDTWLDRGYPPPSVQVLPRLGHVGLAHLAFVMSKAHPERTPYPLPHDYLPPLESAPVRPPSLFEEVAVNGVTRWLVTHRTVRARAEAQGLLPKYSSSAIHALGQFAENIVTRAGGVFPPPETPEPGSFVGEGVVYVGLDSSERTRDLPLVYGIEPGAFLQQYDAIRDGTEIRSLGIYGMRTLGMIVDYADALREAMRPTLQNPQS